MVLKATERREVERDVAELQRLFRMDILFAGDHHVESLFHQCPQMQMQEFNIDYRGRLTACCTLSEFRGGAPDTDVLADLSKAVAADYGVLEEGAGVALRGLFLIDPNGVVMHATINNLPVGRSAKETLRTLKAFQFVAENEGKVCPAEWDEGSDTMDATPEGMRDYLSSHK